MKVEEVINEFIKQKAGELAMKELKETYKDCNSENLVERVLHPIICNGRILSVETIKNEYNDLVNNYIYKLETSLYIHLKKIIDTL